MGAGVELRKKPLVLFVSTSNSVRSQMAEALLRHRAGDQFEVESAGLHPVKEVHPLTRQVLQEVGVDADATHTVDVTEVLGKAAVMYAIILSREWEADAPRVFAFAQANLHWPVDPPDRVEGGAEAMLAAFRRARDQIDKLIRDWLATDPRNTNPALLAKQPPPDLAQLGTTPSGSSATQADQV